MKFSLNIKESIYRVINSARLLPVFMIVFVMASIAKLQAQEERSDSAIKISKLPFAISKEKKLSTSELAHKKEGVYVTGIPDFSSDPINGFGYGGEGSIFFSGKRSDPFFEYTAYRGKLDVALFNTTRDRREIKLGFDIPYIFNTKWRVRGEASYESNPNLLYFGVDEKSLRPLSYYPEGDSTKQVVNNAIYSDYEKSLTGVNQFYNTYTRQEVLVNLNIERSFFQGKLRTLIGAEVAKLNLNPFSGNSLLRNDFNDDLIKGVGNNILITFLESGLTYDTRDLETDPTNGIFAELTNELSLKALGSDYNFNKTFFHFNYYKGLFPKTFKRMIFAGRFGIGYTSGDAPFFRYQDCRSSEGAIDLLGGASTLRGYKQNRFLGRTIQFTNIELRCGLTNFTLLKQNIGISAVPFFDAGGVWDSFDRMPSNLNNLRYSEGIGIRIAWNVNTILRFDYAISKEDKQFFFQMGLSF